MDHKTNEHVLEWLLGYDGKRHFFLSGHFLKFKIRRVEKSDRVPHGIAYSFSFHDAKGIRLMGFDNAHSVQHPGGKFVKAPTESDHWHRTMGDRGQPYLFESTEKLLEDFFGAVEKYCQSHGIPTEVVSVKE